MGQFADRKPAAAALTRSSVRRWDLTSIEGTADLEQVRHAHPGQEWVPHWHEEWSIGAVVHGECLFSLDGRIHRACAGDILSIAPRTVHTGTLSIDRNASGVLVVMFYAPVAGLATLDLTPPTTSQLARSAPLAERAGGVADPHEVRRWLQAALQALSSGQVLKSDGALPSDAVRRVLSSFQASAIRSNALSIREIADECSIGRETLHRIVKRWVGMSPNEYRRALRINMARELLDSGLSVCDAAHASGFADQAHFTRWFRRMLGYTPGDYLNARVLS